MRRPKQVWKSQEEVLTAWFVWNERQEGCVKGWCRAWYDNKALEYDGTNLYSHYDGHNTRLAQYRCTASGEAYVIIVRHERESPARVWRRDQVMTLAQAHPRQQWWVTDGTIHGAWKVMPSPYAPVTVLAVPAFDTTPEAVVAWQTAQVERLFGKYRRARHPRNKAWRMEQCQYWVTQRRQYEQVMHVSQTALEPAIKAALVLQRLTKAT